MCVFFFSPRHFLDPDSLPLFVSNWEKKLLRRTYRYDVVWICLSADIGVLMDD